MPPPRLPLLPLLLATLLLHLTPAILAAGAGERNPCGPFNNITSCRAAPGCDWCIHTWTCLPSLHPNMCGDTSATTCAGIDKNWDPFVWANKADKAGFALPAHQSAPPDYALRCASGSQAFWRNCTVANGCQAGKVATPPEWHGGASCVCPANWTGIRCDQCTADHVCGAGARCDQSTDTVWGAGSMDASCNLLGMAQDAPASTLAVFYANDFFTPGVSVELRRGPTDAKTGGSTMDVTLGKAVNMAKYTYNHIMVSSVLAKVRSAGCTQKVVQCLDAAAELEGQLKPGQTKLMFKQSYASTSAYEMFTSETEQCVQFECPDEVKMDNCGPVVDKSIEYKKGVNDGPDGPAWWNGWTNRFGRNGRLDSTCGQLAPQFSAAAGLTILCNLYPRPIAAGHDDHDDRSSLPNPNTIEQLGVDADKYPHNCVYFVKSATAPLVFSLGCQRQGRCMDAPTPAPTMLPEAPCGGALGFDAHGCNATLGGACFVFNDSAAGYRCGCKAPYECGEDSDCMSTTPAKCLAPATRAPTKLPTPAPTARIVTTGVCTVGGTLGPEKCAEYSFALVYGGTAGLTMLLLFGCWFLPVFYGSCGERHYDGQDWDSMAKKKQQGSGRGNEGAAQTSYKEPLLLDNDGEHKVGQGQGQPQQEVRPRPTCLAFQDVTFAVGPASSAATCLSCGTTGASRAATPTSSSSSSSSRQTVVLPAPGVSGVASGLCAVLGPSGCGKTSLLDIIAGRKTQGTHAGTVAVDGQILSAAERRERVGYVMQEDVLCSTDTVGETLAFTARLVLTPLGYRTAAARAAAVDRVLKLVGLVGRRGTRIGDATHKGLSGGEKRRLSIAIALLCCAPPAPRSSSSSSPSSSSSSSTRDEEWGNPASNAQAIATASTSGAPGQVLVLDEPTSGLDSASASAVLDALTELTTKSGVCVLLTIHQPSSRMFRRFHRVLLLSPRGEVVFSGSNAAMREYFGEDGAGGSATAGMGSSIDIDNGVGVVGRRTSIAEMLLDIVTDDMPGQGQGRGQDGDGDDGGGSNLAATFRDSPAGAELRAAVVRGLQCASMGHYVVSTGVDVIGMQNTTTTTTTTAPPQGRAAGPRARAGVFLQLQALTTRQLGRMLRHPLLIWSHVLASFALAALVILTFQHLGQNFSDLISRCGLFFFAQLFFMFCSFISIGLWDEDRELYLRETNARLYSPLAYFCTRALTDAVLLKLVPVSLFSCLVYHPLGLLWSYDAVIVWWLAVNLTNLTFAFMFWSLAMLAGRPATAQIFSTFLGMMQALLGGFMVSAGTLKTKAWLLRLSAQYYSFTALVLTQFPDDASYTVKMTPTSRATPISGEEVRRIGFDIDPKTSWVWCMTNLTVFFLVVLALAFGILVTCVKEKR